MHMETQSKTKIRKSFFQTISATLCIMSLTACSFVELNRGAENIIFSRQGDDCRQLQTFTAEVKTTTLFIDRRPKAIAEELNIPIEGPHKEDLFWITSLPQQSQMFGFPAVQSFSPDRWLEQGDQVEIGQETLKVFHCPGHTPGHVVFYHQASDLLLVGDVIFQGSIGRTDFPKGDFDTLVNSIRTHLWSLPEHTRFIPGHGPMSNIGHEKATNPFVGGYG